MWPSLGRIFIVTMYAFQEWNERAIANWYVTQQTLAPQYRTTIMPLHYLLWPMGLVMGAGLILWGCWPVLVRAWREMRRRL